MNWLVVVLIVAGLVALRFLRPGLLIWIGAIWVGLYAGIRYGLAVPAPQSVITMYMAITSLALFAYVASNADRAREALTPILGLIQDRRRTPMLSVVALVIPGLVGGRSGVARRCRWSPLISRAPCTRPPRPRTGPGRR